MEEKRQRLKQKDLIAALFVLFADEYDRRGVDSILELELPLSLVRAQLRDRFGIEYTSDTWIPTQIRKYEEEIGVVLFRRSESIKDGTVLGIAPDMRTYFQKRHLYVTQKIKVANGVLDLINNECKTKGRSALRLLLGAGSTVTRIAEALAEEMKETPHPWQIATHNLGVIQALGGMGHISSSVELSVPEGRIDPVTYTILGRNVELYTKLDFDWVVEGTSFLRSGELFVESPEESCVKSAVLRQVTGKKVLVLTGHEAVTAPPAPLEPYGRIEEYDFIVLPCVTRDDHAKSRFLLAMRDIEGIFEPWVLNWNYEILKLRQRIEAKS